MPKHAHTEIPSFLDLMRLGEKMTPPNPTSASLQHLWWNKSVSFAKIEMIRRILHKEDTAYDRVRFERTMRGLIKRGYVVAYLGFMGTERQLVSVWVKLRKRENGRGQTKKASSAG